MEITLDPEKLKKPLEEQRFAKLKIFQRPPQGQSFQLHLQNAVPRGIFSISAFGLFSRREFQKDQILFKLGLCSRLISI